MPSRVEPLTLTWIVAQLMKDRRRFGIGLAAQTLVQEAHDAFTVTATPSSTYTLSTLPLAVIVVAVNGEKLVHGTEWTCDNTIGIVTLDSSVVARLKATPAPADVVSVDYLVTGGLVAASMANSYTTILDWSASGWKYRQTTTSDATDYSSAGYDDSAWSTAATPFGNNAGPTLAATNWTAGTRLWVRRTIPDAVTALRFTFRIDNQATVWVNGTQVLDPTQVLGADNGTLQVGPFPISVFNEAGNNVIAVRADDTASGAGDVSFFDMLVEGVPA